MYDERLVRAAQEGDEAAFAALYDRAVDSVYDLCWSLTGDAGESARLVEAAFVLAARNIDQLTDPTQVRPWLLAIAGDQALADDQEGVLGSGWEGHAPAAADEEPLGTAALRRWVADGAAVLALPDQLVLELQLRHDLDSDQLAAAVGCTTAQLSSILERVDAEATSVLSALILARQGRRNCQGLAKVMAAWDGSASAEVADAADAHAKTCTRCARRRKLLDPLALVAEAPMIVAPAALRTPILDLVAGELAGTHGARPVAAAVPVGAQTAAGSGGSPTEAVTVIQRAGIHQGPPDGDPPRVPMAALAGAAVVLIVLLAAVVLALTLGSSKHSSSASPPASTTPSSASAVAPTLAPVDSTTTSTVAPGSALALNTSRVNLGSYATTAQVVLTDTAATAANWTASTTANWLTVSPSSGSLRPGTTARVTFTVDRTAAPAPSFDARVVFAGSDTGSRSATIEVVGTNHATTTTTGSTSTSTPGAGLRITGVSASPSTIYTSPCLHAQSPTAATITASISDPGGTPSVSITYTLPGQAPAAEQMTRSASGAWTATLPPSSTAGTLTYAVMASDAGGAAQRDGAVTVNKCPTP